MVEVVVLGRMRGLLAVLLLLEACCSGRDEEVGCWGGNARGGAGGVVAGDVHDQHGRGGLAGSTSRSRRGALRGLSVDLAAELATTISHQIPIAARVRCCCCCGLLLVEEVPQPGDPRAGEDAEDVALVVVKLRRGLSAVGQQFVAQEGLYAGEGEVGKFGAVVEEDVDALLRCQLEGPSTLRMENSHQESAACNSSSARAPAPKPHSSASHS